MSAVPVGPALLGFSERRADRYAVGTPDGVVAYVDARLWRGEFTVTDPAGTVVCTGEAARLNRWWDVVDGGGRPVLRQTGWGREVTVEFADGRRCRAHRAFLRRAYTLVDDAGATVLHSRSEDPTDLGLPAGTWPVAQDGSLTLVQFLAAVQAFRSAEARSRRLTDLVTP